MTSEDPLDALSGPLTHTPENDLERTVQELAEVLAAGNPVEAYLGRTLTFRIYLDRVDVFFRVAMAPHEVHLLRETLADHGCLLPMPSTDEFNRDLGSIDPAEVALLRRALEARATLTGA